ncbi:hypothetical protein [Alkalinema sp. FACHB-956]|nr:hypothetical protein [Alkalinema sp. FACHB-956]MBD2326134.1 hypothetical protein [Alkalinema sp. FACHB-956]
MPRSYHCPPEMHIAEYQDLHLTPSTRDRRATPDPHYTDPTDPIDRS